MKVIILGSTGMLGRYIYSYIAPRQTCVALTRSHFNAAQPRVSYFNNLICENDVVINCVGILKPVIADIGVCDTIKINSVFPHIIADICTANKAKFIHISSDCVFSGARGQYTESDICDGRDLYAKTKALGPDNAITLRTSFIGEEISRDGHGLLQWVISRRGGNIDGYDNCLWNGVTCLQFAKLVNDILYKEIPSQCLQHIFSPRVVSKYELCVLINRIYNLNIKINKKLTKSISGTTVNNLLDRSLSTNHSYLNCSKLPDIAEQLIEQKKYEI